MTQTSGRRVSRPGLVLGVVVVLAAVIAAGYVYAIAERRRPVEIFGAMASDDVVVLEVGSCRGEPTVTELDQADGEVRIAVEATTRPLGPAAECLDGIEVQLDAPLRDRVLIDGSNGQAVEVQRR